MICSLASFALPGQAVEPERLDGIEAELNYRNYGSADSIIELEPVYLEDRAVNMEILSNPDPRSRIEVLNEDFDKPYESSGVEIIKFSLPVE